MQDRHLPSPLHDHGPSVSASPRAPSDPRGESSATAVAAAFHRQAASTDAPGGSSVRAAAPRGPSVRVDARGGPSVRVAAPRGPSDGEVTSTEGWVATSRTERAVVLAWVAARCTVDERHLLGVAAVREDPTGAVLVRRPSASGTPLPGALDRIGTLTRGVAVTLSLPLLDLAAAGTSGALDLGRIAAEDVLVDDSGAPLVVDRVPGSTDARDAPLSGHTPAAGAGGHRGDVRRSRRPRLRGHRRTEGGGPHPDADGVCDLVTIVRSVWDRVDPSDEHRAVVDRAITDARGGAAEDIAALVAAVTGAGPPRPVRWVPVPSVFDFLPTPEPPTPTAPGAVFASVVRRLHDGVPLGAGRSLRPRVLLSGVCVLAGLVVAGTVLNGVP